MHEPSQSPALEGEHLLAQQFYGSAERASRSQAEEMVSC